MEANKTNIPKENVNNEDEKSGKGAFASSMLFVGGFIFILYIAIYWLYMARDIL